MKYKLFAILALLISCIFTNMAHSALPKPDLPEQPHPSDPDYPKVPKKPNTSLPPANDPDYGKSKWDKVKKNVKKIGKPSFADVAILVLGEAVDYVLDPENNTARKKKYKCDVHFGSSDGHYDMNSFINHVQSIKKQDAYGSYTYRANSKTIERLEQVRKDTLSLYESGSMGIGNGQWINSANTNFTVDRVRPNSVSSVNLHLGVYVSCINPDYEPEPNPDKNPDKGPNTEPKPNPDKEPNPDKNPDKGPNTEPKPNPDKEPNPDKNPDKGPNAKPEKPFELPAFCAWATKVCDFIDWVKQEPEFDNSTLPEKETEYKDPSEFDKSYIVFGSECPFYHKNIPVGLNSFDLVFDFSAFCSFLSTYAKPVIIFLAYLQGAFIVASGLRIG